MNDILTKAEKLNKELQESGFGKAELAEDIPLTNQQGLAEQIKKMDAESLAHILSNYFEDSATCMECPASEYCNRYYKFYDPDLVDNRIVRKPDENGEILECEDILERWLGEEAK